MTLGQLMTLAELHNRANGSAAPQQAAPADTGGGFGLMSMAAMTRA